MNQQFGKSGSASGATGMNAGSRAHARSEPPGTGRDDSEALALASALVAARREGRALDPREWQHAVGDPAAAYAVQQAVADAFGWCPDGAARHWKSGGPSRETPLTHAPLPPEGVHASGADLSALPSRLRIIEAEVALRLRDEVSAQTAQQLTPAAAEGLVDAACVSIEIVDTRWSDFDQATPLLRLADLQSHGALVLGEWIPYRKRDWAAQRCELRIGAQAPIIRVGTHPLGEPAWLLVEWLRHATRNGATVKAGTVVTTGSWVGMPAAQPGDEVTVEFENLGSARVQL
jgi:2-keto-4-pentenoate hydratase